MMERLMEMAKKVTDRVEIYALEETGDGVTFENGTLKDIESNSQSGISLRIIKDGQLGFAYTKNLINREEFLENALDSLKGKVEVQFDFPFTSHLPSLDTYDPSIEQFSNRTMVEEGQRICEWLTSKTKGQVNISAGRKTVRIRILNSRGTDISTTSSVYALHPAIMFPNSYASIHRPWVDKKFEKVPDSHLRFVLEMYHRSLAEVHPQGGKMKVLFLPDALYALLWRVQGVTNGRNIYQKVSPVMGKLNEKMFDEKLTLYDDPLNDRVPDARGFDDEGTPCQCFSVVEKGVLAHFYYDLHYAGKMGVPPTGHGFKGAMWGGETISIRPSPSLEHLYIRPGERSFEDLLRLMDRGIMVAGVMGAHSGNILNGDYSIGLSPGLYVEKGEILGHVKDAMVAGNIFDTLSHVVALEDTLHPASGGMFPAILFDGVSVATKG
jgi:PmbA protein